MEKITTPECLGKCIEESTKMMQDRISGKNGKRRVLVCGGTSCLANHSEEIIKRFEELRLLLPGPIRQDLPRRHLIPRR